MRSDFVPISLFSVTLLIGISAFAATPQALLKQYEVLAKQEKGDFSESQISIPR
ncbi:MAG: hypothetical protein WBP13_12810 [Methylophilaceae bacterium]